MISAWLRVIRVRFLLASVIAVSVGLAITWWYTSSITIFDAILTMCGVLALHASVDLLNDYWDFKRGIDTTTNRTKMSGGSGVLPEGLLKPTQVYAAGIAFLIEHFCYDLLSLTWMLCFRKYFKIIIFLRNDKSSLTFKSKVFLASSCKITL